jgi:hypothetical protein
MKKHLAGFFITTLSIFIFFSGIVFYRKYSNATLTQTAVALSPSGENKISVPIQTNSVETIAQNTTPEISYENQINEQKKETVEMNINYPGEIIDLTNWKHTLPTGKSKKPTEIKQPDLAKFNADPYFRINSAKNGIVCRAPVNGVTTSNSGYPRSELREMTANGTKEASWSTSSGVHTMYIDQAITAIPKNKKHIVAGQVHDASDDVIVIRLEYPKLFIDINGKAGPTLDPNYTLGKRFTVKFIASNGQISLYYNENKKPTYTLKKKKTGCYFKAGAYTQSNCSKESDCSDKNFGEVEIYKLLLN